MSHLQKCKACDNCKELCDLCGELIPLKEWDKHQEEEQKKAEQQLEEEGENV